jgi:hypothetical protein
MEVRSESKAGPQVPSPSQLVDGLTTRLRAQQQTWLRELAEDPSRFADLEVTVHQTFQQLADQLVASLLAQASQQSPALQAAQKK